jgi:hypothetical protein
MIGTYRIAGLSPARRSSWSVSGLDGFQKTLIGRAGAASVGQEIEAAVLRLDQHQLHGFATFYAWQFGGGLKARASGRRSGIVQHRVLVFQGEDATLRHRAELPHYVRFWTQLKRAGERRTRSQIVQFAEPWLSM